MFSIRDITVDKHGEEVYISTPYPLPIFDIPDGHWTASIRTTRKPPPGPLGNEYLRGLELWLFGISAHEAIWKITNVFGDNNREGAASAWTITIVGSRPFVVLMGLDTNAKDYAVARQEKDGELLEVVSPIQLDFTRGPKGWGWIRLDHLMNRLQLELNQVPSLFWMLVGESHNIQEHDEDGSLWAWFVWMAIDLSSGRLLEVQVDCGMTIMDDGPDGEPEPVYPQLADLPVNDTWIPAGVAIALANLCRYVPLDAARNGWLRHYDAIKAVG